jgi:glycosyltransferase involved in cell wall biosynthesis
LLFDIYGPIKDVNYWEICKNIILDMPANIHVNFKGSIEPIFVQETLQNYHALILPSKGENFGHAIYESLSVGRPVITSNYTPWNGLNEAQIGWNVATEEMMVLNAINELNSLSENEFELYCQNSLLCANEYYNKSIDLASYYSIFK